MTPKALARLLLKLLGIYLILAGAGSIILGTMQLLYMYTQGGGAPSASFLLYMPLYGGGQLLCGLYFFFRGQWVINKMIPPSHPHCQDCGYNLTGNTSAQCPECGSAVSPVPGE